MLSTWAADSWRSRCAPIPRVVSMERTHAARLDPDAADRLVLPEPVTLTVADVSFISLTRLLRGHGGRDRAGR